MKAIFNYRLKELKSNKLASALIVIAIILSTMMTTAIGQSIGVLEAMRIQQASHLNGNRHFTFHNLTKAQVDAIDANEKQSFETSYKGYSSGVLRGVAGSGAVAELLPQNNQTYNIDVRFRDTNSFQSQVDRLISEYEIQAVQYNNIFLDALGITYHEKVTDETNGFDFMFMTGLVVTMLVLLAAGLVVYNILKISVSKKARHFGSLRAIGFEKLNVYKLVLFQVIALCVIGIPIGMLFGYFSAESILMGATSFFESNIFLASSKDELQMLISQHSTKPTVYLGISGAISLCFALIASLPSAKYASTISPITAMNDIAVKINRKNRNTKYRKNFYRYYAKLNMGRNKTRTAISIVSLVMSIVVFLCLSAFTQALDGSAAVQSEFDYSISSPTVGLSQDTLQTLSDHNDIDTVFARSNILFADTSKINNPMPHLEDIKNLELGFETTITDMFELVGLNESYLLDLADDNVDAAQLQNLLSGKACIVRNPLDLEPTQDVTLREFAVGDKLTIDNKELEIVFCWTLLEYQVIWV